MQKMKPKSEGKNLELFKVQLKDIINKDHPLVKLAETIDWKYLSSEIEKNYKEKIGAPGKSIRLMAGLHYCLKQTVTIRNHMSVI